MIPKPTVRPALLLAASLLSACGARQEVPLWEPDRFAETARAFSADSSLHDRERALLEAGLAHAIPGGPDYDPTRAMERLERLVALHPQSSYSSFISYLLPLLGEAERLESVIDRQTQDSDRLLSDLTDLQIRSDRSERAYIESERRVVELLDEVVRLEGALRESTARIRDLEEQLRGLMEIDLTPITPSPSDPAVPDR